MVRVRLYYADGRYELKECSEEWKVSFLIDEDRLGEYKKHMDADVLWQKQLLEWDNKYTEQRREECLTTKMVPG